MPYFETKDQTSLFYYDWGTGQPVVFVHGWAVGANFWEYQTVPLAAQRLRCIAYDGRGCGRSDDPGRGYDYDTLADDLAALLETLNLRDVTLVGHSMAGGIIARFLVRHGASRVARSVLIAPTTPFLLKTSDNPAGIDQAVFDGLVARLSGDRPGYLADIAPSFFGAGLPGCDVSPAMVQWGVALALQASPLASIGLLRTNSETDQRTDLPGITVPTLVIHGDADAGNPVELTGRPTAALIPGAQLKVYENGPHGLPVTHRDCLNADLLKFIRG